jgi:hypothetical protein
MNQIESKLPIIDEQACNYAMIEYSLNNVLKEFDIIPEVYDNNKKTLDSIYNSISKIQNLVKQQKIKTMVLALKLKNNEDVISECKEEVRCMKDLLYDQIRKSKIDDSMIIDDEIFRFNRRSHAIEAEAEAEYEFMERLTQIEKPEITERKSNFLK